jgi:hypothetical protein
MHHAQSSLISRLHYEILEGQPLRPETGGTRVPPRRQAMLAVVAASAAVAAAAKPVLYGFDVVEYFNLNAASNGTVGWGHMRQLHPAELTL